MLPPVVAELRANFGDFQTKVIGAREEWAKTAETIRGTGESSRLAGGQMSSLAAHAARGAENMGALREQSREALTAIRTGVGSVIPGVNELTGAVGRTRLAWREQQAAAAEALTLGREQAAALRLEIDRLTVALDATETKMLEVAPGSRAFDVANDKALAFRDQIAGLNAQLARTNAEMRSIKGGAFAGVVRGGKVAAIGGTVAATAVGAVVGYEGVKAAMQEQAALALLRNAVNKTKESWAQYQEPLESATKQLRALGYTDAETIQSAQMLTAALGDPEKALNLVGLAANVARARHIDLATATKYVQKIATGHAETLGRLGLASKDAAGHTLTTKQAIDSLARAYGGASQAYSHTLKGQLSDLKAQTEHALASIGNRLIPVLEKLGEGVRKAAAWFRTHLLPALQATAQWFEAKVVPAVSKVVGIFRGALQSAVHTVSNSLKGHHEQLKKVVDALRGIAEFVVQHLLPVWAKFESVLIKVVARAISIVITVIAKLVDAFGAVKRATGQATAAIIDNFVRPVAKALLWFAEQATDAIAHAFGWIPGLGGKLKAAHKAVQGFARDTDATLSALATDARAWGQKTADEFHAGMSKAKPAKAADFNISSGYSASVNNVAAKTKAHHAKHLAAHKKHTADLLAEARRRARLMAEAAAAAAKAAGDRVAAALRAQLAAVQEQLRRAQVALKLAGTGSRDLSIVNGSAMNAGTSFAQLAHQRNQQTSVTIQAGGVFMDAATLARIVADALRADGRRNINVGLA